MDEMSITKEQLQEIEKIMQSPEEFQQWLDFVKVNEPEFYVWIQKKVNQQIFQIAKDIKLTVDTTNKLYHFILRMLFSAYMVYVQQMEEHFDEVIVIEGYDKLFTGSSVLEFAQYLKNLQKTSIRRQNLN